MQRRTHHLGQLSAAVLLLAGLVACDQKDSEAPAQTAPAQTTAEQASTDSTSSVGSLVTLQSGQISGEVAAQDGDKTVHIFRGIPYAAPPLGDLRWQPPQPVENWQGVRDATEYGDRCAQRESAMGETDAPPSEDCLYLNVVTAAKTTDEKRPVMVFFHGGGLTSGTGNSPLYNNHALPLKGVVLVTVNSRLGPIGYMAHPALTAESDQDSSGNYGTLDLIASLEWVQDNIAAFGGDPDNVLIFGESGGGTKTLSLISSPLAEGLFHKAIIESGSLSSSPDFVTTLETAEQRGQKIVEQLGLGGSENLTAELREVDWQDLLEAASAEEVGFRANIVVDGWALPESVYDQLNQGKQHDVPLIVGANEAEGRELQDGIPRIAGMWSDNVDSPVYVYNFSHLPTGWREEPCVAFHGVELPYVFGYVPEGLSVPTLQFLKRGGGCTSEDPGADEMDEVVAEHTMQLWVSFAKDGDPSVEGLIDWPAFSKENDRYLDIGYELEIKQGIADAYVAPPERE